VAAALPPIFPPLAPGYSFFDNCLTPDSQVPLPYLETVLPVEALKVPLTKRTRKRETWIGLKDEGDSRFPCACHDIDTGNIDLSVYLLKSRDF
jgi:hypothetical protein